MAEGKKAKVVKDDYYMVGDWMRLSRQLAAMARSDKANKGTTVGAPALARAAVACAAMAGRAKAVGNV